MVFSPILLRALFLSAVAALSALHGAYESDLNKLGKETQKTSGDVGRDIQVRDCLRLEIYLEAYELGSREMRGKLVARNSCSLPVVVLLSPVEFRVCGLGRICFYEGPHLSGNVYARLYVFPSTNGPPARLKGQFALKVYGAPGFGRVEAGETAQWTVSGGTEFFEELPPGAYDAFLETFGASADGYNATLSSLDLGMGVDQHNRRSGDQEAQVFIAPDFEPLSCKGGRFLVKGK